MSLAKTPDKREAMSTNSEKDSMNRRRRRRQDGATSGNQQQERQGIKELLRAMICPSACGCELPTFVETYFAKDKKKAHCSSTPTEAVGDSNKSKSNNGDSSQKKKSLPIVMIETKNNKPRDESRALHLTTQPAGIFDDDISAISANTFEREVIEKNTDSLRLQISVFNKSNKSFHRDTAQSEHSTNLMRISEQGDTPDLPSPVSVRDLVHNEKRQLKHRSKAIGLLSPADLNERPYQMDKYHVEKIDDRHLAYSVSSSSDQDFMREHLAVFNVPSDGRSTKLNTAPSHASSYTTEFESLWKSESKDDIDQNNIFLLSEDTLNKYPTARF